MNIITLDQAWGSHPTIVGGKGMALALMRRAKDFNVPPGFILTTYAHHDWVEEHKFPTTEITAAYEKLGSPPVAVRSSTPSEDGVLSFAGQYATLKNVQGIEAVLHSIWLCWDSLISARAVAYRQALGQPLTAMAVVVQEMVFPEISGVLFTEGMIMEANHPLWGEQQDRLANMGYRLEKLFGASQDIEFAICGEAIHILQSRPITRPLPKGEFHIPKISLPLLASATAASVGIACGPTRITPDPLHTGDVWVLEMLTPEMTPQMVHAKALITESSGLLSHGAIVCRELGIPCVVGCDGATTLLEGVPYLTVDGTNGLVYEGK